ncbi:ThuA domain-containing protein [bacterium]|nr:ThuA domain-containing protein [bacterium]
MTRILVLYVFVALSAAAWAEAARVPATKKIVFLAGRQSHGWGCHAYHAGFKLLAKRLNASVPGVQAVVCERWPKDPAVLEGAAALVIGSDGGVHGFLGRHVADVDRLAAKGVGVACIHYALCEPKGERGGRMLRWIGGYYETWWSVNPVWEADFKVLPAHPITRGVRPFRIKDEWYYHMRFVEGMKGVTPILSAVPPEATRKRPDGAHSGNPHVRARTGMAEHVAWAFERPGGGRGFGFTGNHWHWNWAHDDVRKLTLNAVVWLAGAEVPPDGVPSATPTVEELEATQGAKPPKNWDRQAIRRMIDGWNGPRAAK